MGGITLNPAQQRQQQNSSEVCEYAKLIAEEYIAEGRPGGAAAFAEHYARTMRLEEELRDKNVPLARGVVLQARNLFVEATKKSSGSELEYIAAQRARTKVIQPPPL